MSTESLFASSSNGAHRSRPLQRRLFLLQAVLPCFPLAIEQAGSSAKRFKREFWTNFLTPFSIMKLGKNRLDRIDDQHDGLVSLVLEQLEMVVSMGESDIAEVRSTIATLMPR
jgi:hypothetical protein